MITYFSRFCHRSNPCWMALAFLGCLPISIACANPSSKSPERPLAAHGTIEGASELVDRLYKLYAQEAEFVDETYAKKDDPSKFSDRRLTASAGRLWIARREAQQLQQMGEPAGHDLYKKLQLLAVEVYKFSQSYAGTQRGSQLKAKIQTRLQREKPKTAKFVQQAESRLQDGNFDAYETQMNKKGQELYGLLTFFRAAERKPFDSEFVRVLRLGDTALKKKRAEEYAALASTRIDEQMIPAIELGDSGNRIANEIATSGMAQLADGASGGPLEAVNFIAGQWGAASAGLMRAEGLKWAFPGAKASRQITVQNLKQTALESMVAIIEAAAQSLPAAEVRDVYGDLLESLMDIERQNGILSDDVRRACEPALKKLSAKDPSLDPMIGAYHRATREVLRWRRAYTSQRATHLSIQKSRAGVLMRRKGPNKVDVRPPYARKPFPESEAAPRLFSDPADWMVQEAGARLVGEEVLEDRIIRLTPSASVGVIPLSDMHYGNLPLPIETTVEVDALLSGLLAKDGHAPLTLEAAAAVSAAKRQDFETVLGRIRVLYLESIVTRMIALPDAAYTLEDLGAMPRLRNQLSPVEQTCWRFDLEPIWVQHPCFIVRLDTGTPE